ncbi:DUF397 domain-containing protein [Actinoallomurus purpureus]
MPSASPKRTEWRKSSYSGGGGTGGGNCVQVATVRRSAPTRPAPMPLT